MRFSARHRLGPVSECPTIRSGPRLRREPRRWWEGLLSTIIPTQHRALSGLRGSRLRRWTDRRMHWHALRAVRIVQPWAAWRTARSTTLRAPIRGDEREQPVFHLIPFAGARRKVTDGNRKARFIR